MERLRPGWAVEAILLIIISSILFRCVSAMNHSVGGTLGWDLTSDMRLWVSNTTFLVGDNLIFRYGPNHDVVEVNQVDYALCIISSPIRTHDDGDGETVIHLSQPGFRYFVCGRSGHCTRGLKLQVEILDNTPQNGDHTETRSALRPPLRPPPLTPIVGSLTSPPPPELPMFPPPPPPPVGSQETPSGSPAPSLVGGDIDAKGKDKAPPPKSDQPAMPSVVSPGTPRQSSGVKDAKPGTLLDYQFVLPLIILVILISSLTSSSISFLLIQYSASFGLI